MKKIVSYALLPLLILLWIINKLGQLLISLLTKLGQLTHNFGSNLIGRFSHIQFKLKLPEISLPKKQPQKHYYNNIRSNRSVSKIEGRKLLPTPLKTAIIFGVIIALTFAYSITLLALARELPSPDRLSDTGSPLTTEFYDRNGTLLYKLYEGKNRSLIKLEELPEHLKQATIAIEDKHFYNHSGVDIFGIARAVKAYVQDEQVQGGSTITQQLIKNTLLTPDRTFERKAKEVVLAFWTERLFSKEQILQMYFNEVPYGGPAWGIAAASSVYFDKKPSELTLSESAFLAGLPASPTTYSPYGNNPELGKERQKEVLRRMVEDEYITQSQADEAAKEELAIKPPNNSIQAPHFVMYVRETLAKKYGERTVSQGGLKVTTTIDLDVQNMAESVVAEEVTKLSHLDVGNGAAMITDAKNGQILAMVGSKDYYAPKIGNYNVTTALRQPGSSIKPITYATGFKQGYSPGTILLDVPVVFKNAWETYAPVNYDGAFHGPVSIRTALGSSYNIPAVKMLKIVGIENMIQTAQEMGITTFQDPDRYGLSLTLGGGEVKLIDMMSVYTVFSQNGTKYPIQPVLKIVDAKGETLEDNSNPEGRKVLSPGIAFMISDILSDNRARTPAFGPNSLLNIPGHTVAVKTGTTDNKKDNWTFGYTPEFVIGVWVGNNDGRPMNPSLTSGVTGAAPIWNKLMANILAGRENVAFERPVDLNTASVDGNRDLTISNTPQKSIVGQGKKKIKDEKTQEEKESITFTDPFSTFSTDQLQQIKPGN